MSELPVLLDIFENEMLARFWAGVLEGEGIPSMVQPQMGGYGMWGHDSFIPHGLYVSGGQAEDARAIVASQREAGRDAERDTGDRS